VRDAVVSRNGAEGLLRRAAPDQLGVWDKPAKAVCVGSGVRWELGVVRQRAADDLRIDAAQNVLPAAQACGIDHLLDTTA
jgi:hypothetical protein